MLFEGSIDSNATMVAGMTQSESIQIRGVMKAKLEDK